MDQVRQSIARRVSVTLFTESGEGLTGVTYDQPVVYIQKQNGSAALKTLQNTDWFEIDATHMPGEYDLLLSTTDTNTVGFLRYNVDAIDQGSNEVFRGAVEVIAKTLDDIDTKLGTPAGASVSADIAAARSGIIAEVQLAHRRIYTWTVPVFDGSGRQTSAVKEVYDTKAHAQAHDGATGLLWTEQLTITYSGSSTNPNGLLDVKL
jgi:hypothetical protein